MAKFRKKPVEIEAVRWEGGMAAFETVLEWGGGERTVSTLDGQLFIETLEGTMCANIGDWIIRGVQGEIYPCKPDIFEATYDLVAA